MPVYDYLCAECGPFSELKPMSAWNDPCNCPVCDRASERAILHSPFIAGMDAAKRAAIGINERSAHEPQSSRDRSAHRAGCACCRPLSGRTVKSPSGAKSFPSARPWMISH
jgi:putative FmdB family regulatory protein